MIKGNHGTIFHNIETVQNTHLLLLLIREDSVVVLVDHHWVVSLGEGEPRDAICPSSN